MKKCEENRDEIVGADPISITITALNKIQQPYFGIDWNGEGRLNYSEANQDTRKTAFRHWERVFCYELYHRIRTITDEKICLGENPDFWKKVMLQGELQKKELKEMSLSKMNFEQLEKEYIPDLLFHKIDSDKFQELIIEVKTKPDLTFAGFKNDLNKLSEFLRKYRFGNGMFIAANNSFNSIESAIKRNKDKLDINFEIQKNITIVTRLNESENATSNTLIEITGG